jgi:hypothetical protein
MRWWKGSSGRCAGLLALGLAAVGAQACLDDDERGVRCRDALDCPYGAQCHAHVCALGPSVLRPGAHHDAGALDARIDGSNDAAASDGADRDAVALPDGAADGDDAAGDAAAVDAAAVDAPAGDAGTNGDATANGDAAADRDAAASDGDAAATDAAAVDAAIVADAPAE